MTSQTRNTAICLPRIGFVIACSILVVSPAAWADPPADGAIYRLTEHSSYQHGCFPPCLCPIMIQNGVRGTFKMMHSGNDGGIDKYAVLDVNWSVPSNDLVQPLRIIGSGTYLLGSPDPITIVQHRMMLELKIGDEPVQRFDSGWIPVDNWGNTHINITVSMNNMYCFDTAIVIDANPVPQSEIYPYMLVEGSTFQRGCFNECDCLLGPEQPMGGRFALVPLVEEPLYFAEFAVVDADWHVLFNSAADSIPIGGFGVYQILGDFVAQQRLALELVVGDEARVHFDSGIVFGGGLHAIDVVVTMNNLVCYDTVLHVVANPVVGKPCPSSDGVMCDDGEFCKKPVGHCSNDVVGVCTPIPNGCPDVWDPVCGCDGVTYGNKCEADSAAVSIAHYGECEQVCFGNDCPAVNQFCKYPEGHCGDATVPGVCTTIPSICPDVWDPVCGCDGITYGNECEADAAAVSIRHHGPCEHPCSGILGMIPCWGDMFCLFPEGTCDDGTHFGVCTPKPDGCPDVWDPVCGCDKVTYGNECEAYAAGQSILHRGECARTCTQLSSDPPCEDGEFCKFPMGTCDDLNVSGVCTVIPEGCPEYYDPVCGCDGVTYGNKCEADAAAVSIDHVGQCEATPCAATRFLSNTTGSYCPQVPQTVRIVLTPPLGTEIVALEDGPPPGWVVTNISHHGTFDTTNWKVKWGPFFAPSIPRAVGYNVIPLNDAAIVTCFVGTISVDGVNERICGDACVNQHCPHFMAADTPQPPCSSCPIGDCTSCPNRGCRDGRISLCELIGYACAWKTGCNDNLGGMARAAYIWRNGECYCWDDAQENWYPNTCPPPDSLLCDATDGSGAGGASEAGATEGTATLRVHGVRGRRSAGRSAVHVEVLIEAPGGVSATALELDIPDGWKVATASDDGGWDSSHRKVKWGPFWDDQSRTVSLDLVRVDDRAISRANRLRDSEQLSALAGRVSFDGVIRPITKR